MVELNLQLRQRILLRLLSEKKAYVTGETLGKQMHVSSRTIRKDVLEVNRMLKNSGIYIQSIRGKGYTLQVKDQKSLSELICLGESFLSREDRVRYLTMKLISSNEVINLNDFEDEMFISRTTLERDLHEFKERYVDRMPYLGLFRDKGMIWLECDERKKRIVINTLLVSDWNYNSKGNTFYRNQFLNAEAFEIISTNVSKYLRIYNIKMDDPGLVYFIYIIAIAHMRIQSGYELHDYEGDYVQDIIVNTAINELLDMLENMLNCSFCNEERNYIIHQLTKIRILDVEKLKKDNIHLFIDKIYIYMANSLIGKIKELYNLDFSKDDDFFITLVIHIRMLKNRIFYEKAKPNMLLNRIKREYLFEYELALLFKDISMEKLGIDLDESELIYLTSCLAGAIEKVKNDKWSREISVIIVNHVNHSISWLMKRKLQSIYGSGINIIDLNSTYEKQKINIKNVNLILCTVEKEITKRTDATVLHVSPLLSDNDFESIDNFIEKLREDSIFPLFSYDPELFFPKERFHEDVELNNKEDILRLLVKDFVRDEYVLPEYYDSVLMREKQSSLAIGPGIVLAYAVQPCKKTGISAAVMKHSITWGDYKVNIVVLLSMEANDFLLLSRAFRLVYKKFNYDKKLSLIRTFEELQKYIFE